MSINSIIRVVHLRGEHALLHQLIQRPGEVGQPGQSVVERAAADLHAVPREDVFQPVAGEVIPELAQPADRGGPGHSRSAVAAWGL
jgi:hypothetical protein